MNNDEKITLRIPAEVKAFLEAEADRQDRSVGWLVRKVLRDFAVAVDFGESGAVMKDGSMILNNVTVRDGIGNTVIGGGLLPPLQGVGIVDDPGVPGDAFGREEL